MNSEARFFTRILDSMTACDTLPETGRQGDICKIAPDIFYVWESTARGWRKLGEPLVEPPPETHND